MTLSTKLLLLVGSVSILGFGTLVALSTATESTNLRAAAGAKSHAVAESVATGIQNIMLTGKGILAEELVQDTRSLKGVAALRIYDKEGIEVYLPREKRLGDRDTLALKALETGATQRESGVLVRPMASQKDCVRCHDDKAKYRGAFGLRLAKTDGPTLTRRFVETALENVMISGEADEVDGFIKAVEALPWVRSIVVADPEGEPAFGTTDSVPEPVLSTLARVAKTGTNETEGDHQYYVVPNKERCHVCHGDEETLRGVIALELGVSDNAASLDLAADLFERSVVQLMISDRGNQLETWLGQLRAAPELDTVGLYNSEGAEVYPPQLAEDRDRKGQVTDDARVLQTLSKAEPAVFEDGDTLIELMPLLNEVRCQACHGSDHEVRGIVRLETDLTPVRKAVRASITRGSLVLVFFVVATCLLLLLLLRRLLVHPVLEMSRVAEEVAKGNLDVRTNHTSGDEVGHLAEKLNEMIMGLRQKMMMERFVGDHTRKMIDETVRGAEDNKGPVRRRIAVLFSDVRGFTSYSERNSPERVIETLNVYLGVQAEVVERFGGTIDKFVGDEIMALFQGEDMEKRAVDCALEMVRVVHAVSNPGVASVRIDDMRIGVGINAGDVVFGHTGSRERQDYTVIGDTVNLAARLCSAAAADVVLVSDFVRQAVEGRVTLGEPVELNLKGKAEPVVVYEVGDEVGRGESS